ncbi:hypothetical protein BCR33DRAFT_723219 [Rhizoclosmatium globosum]|uniref:D-aminoacid aminotransferase-like PLP-dependent enzyme n=1 Tax=Rhizoclosmatium globosum TaxID=329046 RepID=A0A1Y2BFH4_9FUNG|nr:hypothetical protein BCR33DRAFT_723219 [Rhizoclosmatium globosum]|eukprot:ORY33237.1 hypothetical protein BCR33DRAFT_723219 [Rhizoclosmatium globosum]
MASVNKKEFLLNNTRGAYTATRTLNRTKVMNWNIHLNRLIESWIGLSKVVGNREPAKEFDLDATKTTISAALGTCLQEYFASTASLSKNGLTDEATITILLLEPSNNLAELRIHIEFQLDTKPQPCTVAFYGSPRTYPCIKDSQWSRDRKPLELAAMKPGISELLLTDTDGNIYEGLTSNFFVVVQDGDGKLAVVTAPVQHVLGGTILRNVESVCGRLGIRFRYEFPKVGSVSTWVGAFVTSSLRILVPVQRIILPNGESVNLGVPECVLDIKKGIMEDANENATELWEM